MAGRLVPESFLSKSVNLGIVLGRGPALLHTIVPVSSVYAARAPGQGHGEEGWAEQGLHGA